MIRRRFVCCAALVAIVATLFPLSRSAAAVSPNLVISQIYGGGGNTGAPYTNDYIEIFNRGSAIVSLAGLSLQYASATGTGNFGANSAQITELIGGTLGPGQYLLLQEASGGASGVPLPTPDVIDATPINMSATMGKVALVSGTTPLGCNGGSTPCPAAALARIIDLIGYDGANFFESAPAPTLSNTTAAIRAGQGCVDTDDNFADFTAGAPSPRNSLSPLRSCAGDAAPAVAASTPANGATGVSVDSNVTIMFSEPVNVIGAWYAVACATSGSHGAAVSGGPTSFTLDPTLSFANLETCTVTVFAAQVTDQDTADPPDNMATDYVLSFTTEAPPEPVTPIHVIQGAAHRSPLNAQTVTTAGIVTALRTNGFYLQDPSPDASDATSEGIFVFTSSAPTVAIAQQVRVRGTVSEFRPGGTSSTNLTITEIVSPSTTVLSNGNSLPPPTVVGTGGRVPPSTVIEDDANGDVETSGVFDPSSDGIDFWESLEGMRVQLNNAVAVGPTNTFGETPVIGDDGANASVRTTRGGVVIRPTDFNPERVFLDDLIVPNLPKVNVGDHYTDAVVGVLDYNFGNFMIELTAMPTVVHDGVGLESATAAGADQLAVATFNVENLGADDPPEKFARLAGLIVNNLRSPDLIAVEEIQDNNGATNDAVVAANATIGMLVSAIRAAGGPTYDWRQIDPVDDQDGGEPGGNIRQAFLFRTDRRLAFVDRPGGTSTAATTVVNGATGPELSFSPGRIDPANVAWSASRKPLAGEFTFGTHHLFVIANHFNSKGGDQPLMGHLQPPTRSSEVQRHQQAQVEHDFVAQIFELDGNAEVLVLGDFNDFEFSETVAFLKGGLLFDLSDDLPQPERYSYVFEGNSQTLDHILVSDALHDAATFDVVHVNAEFADRASDHDPSVARIALNDPPTVTAGGPYTVSEGGSIQLSASGSDPEGGPLTYAWDLDGDGTFETPGQTVTFSALGMDGPATRTVTVRVTDAVGLDAVDEADVQVTNVAPSATFHAPDSVFAGFSFTLSVTDAHDPSVADTAAGFAFAFDCGAGYGAFGPASTTSCSTTTTGDRSVGAKIGDKDGGVAEYRATVHVVVTFGSVCELATSYTTDDGIAKSLCAKLDAAAAARERGSLNSARNMLSAFANEVAAQRGKAISAEHADLLIGLAARL